MEFFKKSFFPKTLKKLKFKKKLKKYQTHAVYPIFETISHIMSFHQKILLL